MHHRDPVKPIYYLSKPLLSIIIMLISFISALPAFSQSYVIVRSESDGKYGVKNENNELIIPQHYVSITLLPESNFLVYEEDPGWPMIINNRNDILVQKNNYIAKALDAYQNHFICQYYKEGKLAELVLFKAPDTVLYTFPLKYISASFKKDSCYTYISAQTSVPGEQLSVSLRGNALTGTEHIDFDYIKSLIKPCNGYAIVIKNSANGDYAYGVYDLNHSKVIIPCNFYDIEFDEKNNQIKTFHKVYTSTYDLYDINGVRLKTWDQIKK
ncbi:MAG: hypothetical protein ACK5CD_04315 [Bacteroidota bacterium]